MLHRVAQKAYPSGSSAYTALFDLIRPVTPNINPAHEEFLRMLPSGVVGHVWTEAEPPELAPAEAAGVRRAVEGRRDEFARGRGCARRVLEALGLEAVAIPMGPDRAPVWPDTVIGSITHTEGFVAAAGAERSSVSTLGIDVERIRPLGSDVAALVLTPDDATRDIEPEWGVLAFSAKESVHKAVHPATGEWLDFLDVSIVPDDAGSFRVVAASERARSLELLHDLRGTFRIIPPFVMTLVYRLP